MDTLPEPSQDFHRWRFFRAGGVDQVRLETGADLVRLSKLDQKLWVALSCPVKGIEFDERSLALIDTDKDGRVRAPELIAAVEWTASLLKDPNNLVREARELPIAAINDATPEGKQLLASAKQILLNLAKSTATAIAVEDTTNPKIFGQTKFNGDGIITPNSAEDDTTRQVIENILSTHGGEPDRSGAPGISQAKVDAFFADAQAFSDWHKKAETDASVILPLGEGTTATYAALQAVRVKVDDYFARCRLAAFDSRALAALNRSESEYLAIAAKDLSITNSEVAGFPLARIEAAKPLPLGEGLNPAWAGTVAAFRSQVVAPLLGKDKPTLTAEDWSKLTAKFAAYQGWLASKAGAAVEPLGLARVRAILASPAKEQLTQLIAEDKKLEPEANAIANVERLTRFYRDLHPLLVNFVSFEDFYSRKRKAVFQAGTLYLDGRSCDLCVRVDDAAKHGTLAALAKTYLAYCDCTRPSSGEKMTIAAAFTDGDSDHLMVGRNGLFYDRKGRDWDATIVKIIDNPISIRQAFWSPYKRFVRAIEEAVAKRAAAAEAAGDKKLTAAATTVAEADKTKPAEPKKMDVGTVAAIGVAVGGIVAALGAVLQTFFGLGMWMPLGMIALVLIISGPSMIIAWLKLRQRNLGPILDANGWAVNGRVRINVPFGKALTSLPKLPPGADRSLTDPYAEKERGWTKILFLAVVLALAGWYLNHRGKLHDWFGIGKEVQKQEEVSSLKPEPPTPATPPATNEPAKP